MCWRVFLALFERRRRQQEDEEEKFKKDSAVIRVSCMYLYSSQGCDVSLHSCYRHLTGLHFPGMRYVVVLWPDPKTPATDRQWTFGDWDPCLGVRFQSACHGTSEFTNQSLAPIWEWSVVTVGFSSCWIIARCRCDLYIYCIYIYMHTVYIYIYICYEYYIARGGRPPAKDPPNSQAYIQTYIQAYT